MSVKQREIDTARCRFQTGGEFELGDNGEEAKTAPIKMLARTGQPINHPYWGPCVHDFSGMKIRKTKVAIDYKHNGDSIGYANHFNSESGDLWLKGALVPWKDNANDKATEIIHKWKHGVPYEASIDFGGEGIKLQELGEGEVAEVNGYLFEGPGTIFREWPLVSVAICQNGADSGTQTEFSSGEKIVVEVIDTDMDTEQEKDVEAPAVETSNTAVVEDQNATVAQAETESQEVEEVKAAKTDAEVESANVEAPEANGEALVAVEPSGAKFMNAFGEQAGALYFAKGLSFEVATAQHLKWQAEEIEKLQTQLTTLRSSERGMPSPLTFSGESNKANTLADLVTIR